MFSVLPFVGISFLPTAFAGDLCEFGEYQDTGICFCDPLEFSGANGDCVEIPKVGGDMIPIDATAVLIAGMQTNALSVLSAFVVIGAIAFGTLYFSVKRKRN